MPYYVIAGKNGAIIKDNFPDADRVRKYLHKAQIRRYATFDDAEIAALDHLNEIKPIMLPPVVQIGFNELVTMRKYHERFLMDNKKEE